nr:activating signal cointegrator 1 complex subunit 1-like [Leptinotarsa decemlineata]XP_023020115.1 activating signal cointegrator 1 complex subunit 1-like [Leptinotarsa decemlineata]
MKKKQFPDFFTEKGPIQTIVTPLNFGNSTYWMSSVLTEHNVAPQPTYMKPYDDNEGGLLDCGEIEENYEIVLTKSGKFMTSFYVPSALLSYIIGSKGLKLKSLQKNTNTLIKVPKLNEKGEIKITGDTERKVASARTQISMIVMQRKDKLPISHFVSIPIVSENIREKYKRFQDEILNVMPRGVTQSIFQQPEKLHLTICTLTLLDDEELHTAKQVLDTCHKEFISNILDSKHYKIHLDGVEIMNDDPSSVNVLYGNVRMDSPEENEKLQEISDKISEYFYRSGLAKKQYDNVKLHVTLMNTSFRNSGEKQESFDATNILRKYKNYYFGSVDLKNIHLSVRFTGRNEYYESALVIDI